MDILTRLYKFIEKLFEPVKDFIYEYHGNPLFWIVILIGSFFLFGFIYDALRKEK